MFQGKHHKSLVSSSENVNTANRFVKGLYSITSELNYVHSDLSRNYRAILTVVGFACVGQS